MNILEYTFKSNHSLLHRSIKAFRVYYNQKSAHPWALCVVSFFIFTVFLFECVIEFFPLRSENVKTEEKKILASDRKGNKPITKSECWRKDPSETIQYSSVYVGQ